LEERMRGLGIIASAFACFSVLQAHGQPSITQDPQSQTAVFGRSVTFSVYAIGNTPLQYQWEYNGSEIPGATARTLKFTASPTRAGVYSVRVRDAVAESVSSPAELEVLLRPAFMLQPQNTVVGQYGTAVFTTEVNDSGPYTRMIWHNSNPLEGSHQIPSTIGLKVNEPTLTIPNCLDTDSYNGLYWFAVTNAAAGAKSRKARLTVVGPPRFSRQPPDRTVNVGTTIVLTVKVVKDAGPPVTYQWHKDGRPIPGATLNRLVLPAVQTTDTGNYYCVASGIGGTATSWGGQITVLTPAPRP
jgi:hypothetical protein